MPLIDKFSRKHYFASIGLGKIFVGLFSYVVREERFCLDLFREFRILDNETILSGCIEIFIHNLKE